MKNICTLITLTLATVTLSMAAYASSSEKPICAQINNQTNQPIKFDLGNGQFTYQRDIVISSTGTSPVYIAQLLHPELVFTAGSQYAGNIKGAITVTSANTLPKISNDANVSISSVKGSLSTCDEWIITVHNKAH